MRYSKLLGKTLRQASKAIEGSGLARLLRAGMVRNSGPGSYVLLPLGARVMRKLCGIAESAFTRAGAQRVLIAPYAPAFKDQSLIADLKRALAARRRDDHHDYFLAASHEEALGALASGLNLSYRELPVILAQQQWKYRDGGRWFLLEELFAFGEQSSLDVLIGACKTIFAETGISVSALDGPRGVAYAIFSDAGSETFAVCDSCEYRALWDVASSLAPEFEQSEEPLPRDEIFGPGMVSVAEIAAFAKLPFQKVTKTLLFVAARRNVAVCVRGDSDVSEAKLKKALQCSSLELAEPALVTELTGAEVGYAGPIGLRNDVEVIWDLSAAGRINFEAGANKTGHHLLNLNFGGDLPAPDRFVDVRQVREGDRCGRCSAGHIQARSGDRVAHATATDHLYSTTLGAAYAAREGGSHPLRIDCCGVDLSRLFVAAAEQHADERGLTWPAALAPFEVHLVSLAGAEARGEEVYSQLCDAGVEVLWDDRPVAAGAKFSDADLIGIPLRLVVSPKTGEQVEWKPRGVDAVSLKPLDDAVRDARLFAMRVPPES